MKIGIVLEKAKFSKEKVIAYHATSKKNLRSIIKNGLIMNYRGGGLGDDEMNTDFGFGYEPHEGVYFTTNFGKAKNFARWIDSSEPAIIIAEVQPKSSYLDEDDLFQILDKIDSKIYGEVLHILDKYNHDDSDEMFEEIDQMVETITKETTKTLSKNLKEFYNLNPVTVENIIKRSTLHIKSLASKLVDGRITGSTDIRDEQDGLRKIFKNIVRKYVGTESDKISKTFSIPSNVGFRGSNKIVGIIDLAGKKAWGKHIPSDFSMVDAPVELLD